MRIAIDIDGTITAHPEFFRELALAWTKHTSKPPVYLTARHEWQRQQTLSLLASSGIFAPDASLVMFPDDYNWPYETPMEELEQRVSHAKWKAKKCVELGVSLLIDDCHHNATFCRAAGIFVLQALPPAVMHSPLPKGTS